MNCIVNFYEDQVLQNEYSTDEYNRLLFKRDSDIKSLCGLFFESIHYFYHYQAKKKSNNNSCKINRSMTKLDSMRFMHQITLILYCGNCKEMVTDYYNVRKLNHFTHYLRYTDGENLNNLKKVFENLRSSYEINGLNRGSLIVFDLDNTLIDDSLRPLSKNLEFQLSVFRKLFDYVVLWSHGTSTHVSNALNSLKLPYRFFHVIITRADWQSCGGNKGLGFVLSILYNKYKVREITFSCIVDDTKANFTNDYMVFIHIPSNHPHNDLTKFYQLILERLRNIKFRYEISSTTWLPMRIDLSTVNVDLQRHPRTIRTMDN
ncbi:uncharacterized protein [Chelonus insularis]|uniref:uncharacterized protein n=1 Tax=Chelonus insularis TaxID=460826 RepID=UPI00158CDAA7|nr:uncharacterized protein LOC118065267 [Chelonus insularis]KAG8148348.1 38k protein [Chelonus insularis]